MDVGSGYESAWSDREVHLKGFAIRVARAAADGQPLLRHRMVELAGGTGLGIHDHSETP
jgi:hypothetical protein